MSKYKYLLLLLTFHVSFLSFLDAEKTHFWDFFIRFETSLKDLTNKMVHRFASFAFSAKTCNKFVFNFIVRFRIFKLYNQI